MPDEVSDLHARVEKAREWLDAVYLNPAQPENTKVSWPDALAKYAEAEVKELRAERDKYLAALTRIATGEGVCVSYEYDPAPTEQEIAKAALPTPPAGEKEK